MLGYELTLDRLDWYAQRCPRFIVCADSGRSMRKEAQPSYKSNRKPRPAPAIEALQGVEARVKAWPLPFAQVDGWEGDDVIATLCHQAWPEEVQIIGSEKDFFCLIDDERVKLIGKNGPIDGNECMRKFGVAPSQMTDWLTMVGDAADGVPGCPNCGPARAAALLERFGGLDCVLAAVRDGALIPGLIPGVGKGTVEALREWNPESAQAMIRMRTDLSITLGYFLRDEL